MCKFYHIIRKAQLFFVILILSAIQLNAQEGFKGTVVFGSTLSQLDGDLLVGFRKLGLTGGIKLSYGLNEKLEAGLEMIYNQRGSRSQIFGTDSTTQFTSINYFEMPIYLTIRDWYIKEGNYYKLKGHIGFSYGNLINSNTLNETYDPADFRKNDFGWIIGATYSFNPRLGFTARYNRSFTKLLSDDSLRIGYLLSYFWSLRLEYNF